MKKFCLMLYFFSFSAVAAMQTNSEHIYGAPLEQVGSFCMFRLGTGINQNDLDAIFTTISDTCDTPLVVIRIAQSGGKLLVFHSDREGLAKDIQKQLASHRITHLSLKEFGEEAWPAIIQSPWVDKSHIAQVIDEVYAEDRLRVQNEICADADATE